MKHRTGCVACGCEPADKVRVSPHTGHLLKKRYYCRGCSDSIQGRLLARGRYRHPDNGPRMEGGPSWDNVVRAYEEDR